MSKMQVFLLTFMNVSTYHLFALLHSIITVTPALQYSPLLCFVARWALLSSASFPPLLLFCFKLGRSSGGIFPAAASIRLHTQLC